MLISLQWSFTTKMAGDAENVAIHQGDQKKGLNILNSISNSRKT